MIVLALASQDKRFLKKNYLLTFICVCLFFISKNRSSYRIEIAVEHFFVSNVLSTSCI